MKGFVRAKKIRGKRWFYWCYCKRNPDTGKPQQKVIACLGKHESVAIRKAYFYRQLRKWERQYHNAERRQWRGLSDRDYSKELARLDREIKRAKKFLTLCSACE